MGISSPLVEETDPHTATIVPGDVMFFDVTDSPLLEQRLQRLSPEKAQILCDLFEDRGFVELEGKPATTWRFAPARKMSGPALSLRSSGEELLISLTDDGLRERLGEREWFDYEGDWKLMAWSLAHTTLVEGISRLVREPLLPLDFCHVIQPPADPLNHILLRFSVRSTDGRSTDGVLGLSTTLAARLTVHAGWRRQILASHTWGDLPAALRLEIDGIRFPLSELRAAVTGDVLVLGKAARCWHNVRVTSVGPRSELPLASCRAVYQDGRLLASTALNDLATEKTMSDSRSDELLSAGAAALEKVPITLDFEVGTLAVPLHELTALKPGYVFRMPGRLEEARVVIRANGTKVGHGELVVVGDVLGVQLLSIDAEGVR